MKTENRQGDMEYDMIFMLGGLWEAVSFFVRGASMIVADRALLLSKHGRILGTFESVFTNLGYLTAAHVSCHAIKPLPI